MKKPIHKMNYTEMLFRIEELEGAIRKHYSTFPDEPLQGETELWKHVGIDVPMSTEGRFLKK